MSCCFLPCCPPPPTLNLMTKAPSPPHGARATKSAEYPALPRPRTPHRYSCRNHRSPIALPFLPPETPRSMRRIRTPFTRILVPFRIAPLPRYRKRTLVFPERRAHQPQRPRADRQHRPLIALYILLADPRRLVHQQAGRPPRTPARTFPSVPGSPHRFTTRSGIRARSRCPRPLAASNFSAGRISPPSVRIPRSAARWADHQRQAVRPGLRLVTAFGPP